MKSVPCCRKIPFDGLRLGSEEPRNPSPLARQSHNNNEKDDKDEIDDETDAVPPLSFSPVQPHKLASSSSSSPKSTLL